MLYDSERNLGRNEESTLSSALQLTRTGAEAIRRGGGIFGSTQLAAEIEALRQYGDAAGFWREFERLSHPPDAFGYEHQVWLPTNQDYPERVLKATYANCFGHLPDGTEAGPVGYFERLILQNEVLGDDIHLEGLVEPATGLVRIVTSQPAVAGRAATEAEIHAFFAGRGFIHCRGRYGEVWFLEGEDLLCADTHGGNILVTEAGSLVAIDVPVMRRPDGFKIVPV